jgi:microcystin-dependent protein
LTASYFGTSATVLGAAGGAEKETLTIAQMPSHYHAASIYDPGHAHGFTALQQGSQAAITNNVQYMGTSQFTSTAAAYTGVRVNSSNGLDTTYSAGGSAAHPIVSPVMLATIFIKL